MLRYLATGDRFYGLNPHGVYNRNWWEFQAVVAGELAPVLAEGQLEPVGQRLWVFPPETPHGWTGHPAQSCEVVVFHLSTVPDVLRQACDEDGGSVSIDLTPADIDRLRAMVEEADANLRHPTMLSSLHYQRIQLDLTLLALRGRPPQRLAGTEAAAQQLVENAIAWFSEHLAEAPTLDQVARAVYVSPAHFRRLFHQVLGSSPRQALDQIRFQRAMQLMEQGMLTMEAVARACGLGSASAFSRAFKKWHGVSPREWLRGRVPVRRRTE